LYEASSAASGGAADGEVYYQDLSEVAPKEEGGNLYNFALAGFQKLVADSAISGNGVLNTQAVDRIIVEFSGLTGAGTATIHTIKFKKENSFFVTYFWFFLAMSILFFLCYTVYATPFVAFGYEMTPDYHERTRLHAFANTVGQLAWLGVPWFYAIMSSSLFNDTVHGARTLALFVGAFVAIVGVLPAIFLRERQALGGSSYRRQDRYGKHERILQGCWYHTKLLTVLKDMWDHFPGVQRVSIGYVVLHLRNDLLPLRRQ